MSETHYDKLHNAIFDALALALNITETKANALIRFTTPDGESSPFEEYVAGENRCYVRLSSATLFGVGMRDRSYELSGDKTNRKVQILDGVTAMLMFYGSNAVTNAETVKVWLNEGKARQRLSQDGLSVVENGRLPVWLPELVNGNWVSRCDLEVMLYRLTEHTREVDIVTEAPEINIRREI